MKTMYNKELVGTAKCLRKNMTQEEKHLWYDFLKNYPVKFYRQKPIGDYIVDFYCSKAKTVIELDGSQHYEEKEIVKDKIRTEFISKYKIKVIRIANDSIRNNFDGVCVYIDDIIKHSL